MWNSTHIDHVQITVAETVGVEGRGDYYDGAGALRDMVQNHMLQLLALVAMEPPSDFNATAVRDEKVKVLRALRPITAADAEAATVTGQYARGAIDGEPVPGYAEELGPRQHDRDVRRAQGPHRQLALEGRAVLPAHRQANARRATPRSSSSSRDVPYSIFASRGATTRPNKLIIGLQPEESIELRLMAKTPGLDRQGVRLREVPLDIGLANAFSEYRRRIAYERLLLDLDRRRPDPVRPPRRGRGAMGMDRRASAPPGRKRASTPRPMRREPGARRPRSR